MTNARGRLATTTFTANVLRPTSWPAAASLGEHESTEPARWLQIRTGHLSFWLRRSPGARGKCPMCRGAVHAPLPVEARAMSGRPIDVISVPDVGRPCHLDRHYVFRSLGGFNKPGMLYVITSNEDRKVLCGLHPPPSPSSLHSPPHTSSRALQTPATEVMWILETKTKVIVHINFRSDDHLAATMGRRGRDDWLSSNGWERNERMASTVSSGVPNGPYSGPVFSKVRTATHAPTTAITPPPRRTPIELCPPRPPQAFEADATIRLMGSNTWEGTYFVFVETQITTP